MSLLAIFFPPTDGHPGWATSMPSPNVFGNGIPVLVNPFWSCFCQDPPHPSGIMNPQTDVFGVYFNGMGAGMVSMSISPCGAMINYGSYNINVGV